MWESTLAAREAVVAHLEALQAFITPIDGSMGVTRLLHNSILRWRAAPQHEGMGFGASLAAESCEVVVAVLRLLRGDLGLPPSRAVHPYTCVFLVLANTVRVFEEARDTPAAGQTVTLHGLQHAASQRLNGVQGVIMRFHPESGRFLVRLSPEDPPPEWKKVRPENLVVSMDACPSSPSGQAVSVARAHGLACLEAVADIFDDILQDLLLEAGDVDDDVLQKVWAADLASAMWEVLVCCAGDGSLRLSGASFAELCGSTALCALFARYVLLAQLGFHNGFLSFLVSGGDQDGRGARRLRSLQESLMRSYCELYQPAALWREDHQAGDAPIAELQADLEAHVRSVAEAAVSFGVLPALLDSCDFHMAWVVQAERPGPLPLVLPVLLSRLVCSLLAPATAAIGSVRRHVQMHVAGITESVHMFTTLVSTRLSSQGLGATPSEAELLAALRAVLDCLVAVTAVGLWSLGSEVAQEVDSIAARILDVPIAAADAAVLARLVLIFMRQPPMATMAASRLAAQYNVLPQVSQTFFWGQLRARGSLCNLPVAETWRLCQEWLAASGVALDGTALAQAAECATEREVACQNQEIDNLIDKCLRELPLELRATPANPRMPPSSASGAGQLEAPVMAAPAAAALAAPWPDQALQTPAASVVEQPRLSFLDMPALPHQQPQASGSPKRGQKKKLARADFGKIRGVDPAEAPQELRCAIDGKILGTPVRSPYGHLFERETLENWVNMCGSICPLTGQPLRMEDCVEDRAVAHQVLEWARAAKAEHKRQRDERRAHRQAVSSAQAVDVADLS